MGELRATREPLPSEREIAWLHFGYRQNVAGRSSFGAIKKLPSGRVRAWYVIDGVRHTAGHTFPNKAQADEWLKDEWNRRRSGTWTDRRGRTTLRQFVEEVWWPTKVDLSLRTRELYAGLLKNWIYAEVKRPTRPSLLLGDTPVMQITEDEIEQWYLACKGRNHAVACAKAYRLFSEIMIFADEKRAVVRNPVHIRGAGAENAPEREALTVDELVALSDAIEARYRAMILLATFGAMRWSESLALQRRDIYLDRKMVTLRRVIVEPDKGEKFVGPLKARDEKATRRVDLPDELVPVLEDHLKQFVGTQPIAWLFEDPDKGLLARSQFRLLLDKAKEVTGLDDVTFHVLRHTGATWLPVRRRVPQFERLWSGSGTVANAWRCGISTPPQSECASSLTAWAVGSAVDSAQLRKQSRKQRPAESHASWRSTGRGNVIGPWDDWG